MIDIHTHILPHLDDGAWDEDEACAMAEMAVRSGVTGVIATPHTNLSDSHSEETAFYVQEQYDILRQILEDERIPLALYTGMEIWAAADIADKIRLGSLFTLNHSRYVLVEFDMEEEPWWIDAVIHEVTHAGLFPIIAHPERYVCVQEDPDLVQAWNQNGAYAQMNKDSIFGWFGRREAHAAETLLKAQSYSFIASDAHHADVRTTEMKEICRYIEKHYSAEYAYELMEKNPLLVLQDREVRRCRQKQRK